MPKEITFVVNGASHRLSREDVRRAVSDHEPEAIREHFVFVDGVAFPVKQAFSLATKVPPADFTSHRARDVLRRLGFTSDREADAAVVPNTWVLHTVTPGGGHQEFELPDDTDIEDLDRTLAAGLRGQNSDPLLELRAYHPDAVGGQAVFRVPYRHVATAYLYQREASLRRD